MHNIHPYKKERDSIREIKLEINVSDSGKTKKDRVRFKFDENSYREHDDRDTDVYILDVTMMFLNLMNAHGLRPDLFGAPIEYLTSHDGIYSHRKNEIKISDEVLLIGYPSTANLQNHTTNFPFVSRV